MKLSKEFVEGLSKILFYEEMEEGSEAFNAIGNSSLGPHAAKNKREEHFKIRLELRRLGIRKGMRYEPERL